MSRPQRCWTEIREFVRQMMDPKVGEDISTKLQFTLPRFVKGSIQDVSRGDRERTFRVALEPISVAGSKVANPQKIEALEKLVDLTRYYIPEIKGVPIATLTLKVHDQVCPVLTPYEKSQFTRIFRAHGTVDSQKMWSTDDTMPELVLYTVTRRTRRR